ncbi:ATP-binding cassette glutathione S-conjugate transporter ycf1, partial [Coemansia sp. RSA 487]
MTGGTGAVVGSMALVEQTPWIMSGTLRENILFGQEYDEEYYKKVIYACALTEDINNWINKDLTLIGERGINISGGQKARLALARAVYSRADIYILDDPLSAVDAHVKRHILDHVIMDTGILAGKIRIMSVNTNNILPYFDKVLTLNSSRKVSVSQNTREDYQLFAAKSDVVFDNGDICSKFNNDGNSNKASNPEDDTE